MTAVCMPRRAGLVFWTGFYLAVLTGTASAVKHHDAVESTSENDQNEPISSLLADIFSSANPYKTSGGPVVTKEFLDRGARRIRKDRSLPPVERAKVLDSIGYAYSQQKLSEEAIPLLEEALKILQGSNKEPDGLMADVLSHLGDALYLSGRTMAAERHYDQALALNRKLFGDNDRRVARDMVRLASLKLAGRGDLKATEQLLTKGLSILQTRLGRDHPDTIYALLYLASLMIWKDDLPAAEHYQREALRISSEKLPRNHPSYAEAVASLGFTLMKRGQLDAAEHLMSKSIELHRKFFGAKNPQVIPVLDALAWIQSQRGFADEAVRLVKEALNINLGSYGTDHYMTGYYFDSLAKLYWKSRQSQQAESAIKQALAIYRQTLSSNHLFTASSQHTLGEILLDKGDFAGAETQLRAAIATCAKASGANNWRTARSENALGAVLAKTGRMPEAEKILATSYQNLRTALGDKDELTQLARKRLALVPRNSPRPMAAAAL